MNYQQSSFSNNQLRARSGRRRYSWSDPTQIDANRQGIITQEQRRMLDKGAGCLYSLFFCLYIFSIIISFLTIIAAIYLLFTGKLMLFENYTILRLIIPFVLIPIFGKLSSVLRRTHNAQFTRATDALLIGHVQGEITWEKEGYIARTSGFRLKKPSKSPALSPPGPYHFYYVIGQNILLSAQPIHTYTQAFAHPNAPIAKGLPGDEQARQTLQTALCNTLDFSLPDLYANRLGMLTDTQRHKLSNRVFWSMVGSFIGLLLGGGGLIAGIVSLLNGWITYTPGTNLLTPILGLGFFALLLLALSLTCLHYLTIGARKRYDAIQREPVQHIEGNIQTRVVDRGSDSTDLYYYDIESLSFEVTGAALDALISSIPYRVYYLASSKTLVSIEPLKAPIR